MKGFRYYVLLSSLAVAVSCPAQSLLAAETGKSAPAKIDETTPRQDRGASFTEIVPPAIMIGHPTVPAAISLPKQPARPAAVSKHMVSPKMNIQKRPVTAVKPHAGKENPAAASTATTPGAASSAASPVANTSSHPEAAETPAGSPVTSEVVTVSHAVVAPNPATAAISAWLDKPGATPRYRAGDKMVVNVTAATDCNLVIFNYDAKGTLTQLFPNDMQTTGFVKAGENVQIGGQDSPFDYEVSGKGGLERIFVYAYPTAAEQPFTVAMNPVPHSPFRSAEMSIERYRELVNSSKVFFSREVKVVPKTGARLTSASTTTATPPAQPNKVELTFQVEGK